MRNPFRDNRGEEGATRPVAPGRRGREGEVPGSERAGRQGEIPGYEEKAAGLLAPKAEARKAKAFGNRLAKRPR